MNLEELKRLREEKVKEHKQKKRAYYLKSKLQKNNDTSKAKKEVSKAINYEVELFGGDLSLKLKEIAKKQRQHVESREDIIKHKLQEYQLKSSYQHFPK